jgi:acyl dehydratase
MPITLDSIPQIKDLADQPSTRSEPILIDQAIVDQFALVTKDEQWIHIDRERARAESPMKPRSRTVC